MKHLFTFLLVVVFAGEPIPMFPLPDNADDFPKTDKTTLDLVKARVPRPFQTEADVKCDGPKAFVIGGVNTDNVLRYMTCLTGLPIDVLQARMLPQKWPPVFPASVDPQVHKKMNAKKVTMRQRMDLYSSWLKNGVFAKLPKEWKNNPWRNSNKLNARVSAEGFLNVGQHIRDVLMKDNKLVFEMGLTHQKVAMPLIEAIGTFEIKHAEARMLSSEEPKQVPFEYADKKGVKRKYLVGGTSMGRLDASFRESGWGITGIQGSPFHDDLHANWIVEIQAIDAAGKPVGASLKMDTLTPNMIYRYGFYQGGQYRRAGPTEIAKFFGLI